MESTWWHLRAHSRTLSRRHWLNSQWRVCASSYHSESESKQQSWPYISARGTRTPLSTLAPCPSLSYRWEWGTEHNILVLTFCFSASSSPASDQNPISQSQPETSESQGSCYNISQRTRMLIVQYLISLKPWELKESFRINSIKLQALSTASVAHRKLFWLVPQFVKTKKKCLE